MESDPQNRFLADEGSSTEELSNRACLIRARRIVGIVPSERLLAHGIAPPGIRIQRFPQGQEFYWGVETLYGSSMYWKIKHLRVGACIPTVPYCSARKEVHSQWGVGLTNLLLTSVIIPLTMHPLRD